MAAPAGIVSGDNVGDEVAGYEGRVFALLATETEGDELDGRNKLLWDDERLVLGGGIGWSVAEDSVVSDLRSENIAM